MVGTIGATRRYHRWKSGSVALNGGGDVTGTDKPNVMLL